MQSCVIVLARLARSALIDVPIKLSIVVAIWSTVGNKRVKIEIVLALVALNSKG